MDIYERHAALAMLRESSLEKRAADPKPPGFVRTMWRAAKGGAAEAGRLAKPAVGDFGSAAIKYAPHAALVYGAYKALNSQPVKNLKYKYDVWRARQAQEQAAKMGGYR